MSREDDIRGAMPVIEAMDSVRIENRGRVVARAGLTISLCFEDEHTWPVREKLLRLVDAYRKLAGEDKITWWVREGGRPQATVKIPIDFPKLEAMARDPQVGMSFAMGSGAPDPETCTETAQEYWFEFIASSPSWKPAVGDLRMGLPAHWVFTRTEERSFVPFLRAVVNYLQPLHGSAGFGMILPANSGVISGPQVPPLFYPFAIRFPGLEFLYKLSGFNFAEGMYTVNWLTVVQDKLLAKLGGREAVKARCLEAGLGVEELGACLMIQAGDGPGIGDTEQGIDLPLYREAARILKPIRVIKAHNPCITPPPYGSDDLDSFLQAQKRYLERFD